MAAVVVAAAVAAAIYGYVHQRGSLEVRAVHILHTHNEVQGEEGYTRSSKSHEAPRQAEAIQVS